MNITFRESTKDDEAFIYSSWLNSSWLHNLHDIKKTLFFQNEKRDIAEILKSSKAIIACDPQTPQFIYGYIVFNRLDKETLIIHYIYVKEPLRRFKIANMLIEEARKNGVNIIFCTYNKGKRTEHIMQKFFMMFKPQLRRL